MVFVSDPTFAQFIVGTSAVEQAFLRTAEFQRILGAPHDYGIGPVMAMDLGGGGPVALPEWLGILLERTEEGFEIWVKTVELPELGLGAKEIKEQTIIRIGRGLSVDATVLDEMAHYPDEAPPSLRKLVKEMSDGLHTGR